MHLGIDRSKIGDILVEENACRIFCMTDMADYLCRELRLVRHTNLMLEKSEIGEISITPKFERIAGSVASLRLDCILALESFQKQDDSVYRGRKSLCKRTADYLEQFYDKRRRHCFGQRAGKIRL